MIFQKAAKDIPLKLCPKEKGFSPSKRLTGQAGDAIICENKNDSLGRGEIPHRQSKSAKGVSLRTGEIPVPTVQSGKEKNVS